MQSRILRLFLVLVPFLFHAAEVVAKDTDWRPIVPEELQATDSLISPGAPAEYLYRDIAFDYNPGRGLVVTHYVRIKIFDMNGVDRFGSVAIEYTKFRRIEDLKARTVSTDGKITAVATDAIFSQDLVKRRNSSFSALRFAFPQVRPGSIVEYQYREVSGFLSRIERSFDLQAMIPTRVFKYRLRTIEQRNFRFTFVNITQPPASRDDDGYTTAMLVNLPPVYEEPFSPSFMTIGAWMHVWYDDPDLAEMTGDFWTLVAAEKIAGYAIAASLKPNPQVTKKANEIVAAEADPIKRLRRLYDYCQREIEHLSGEEDFKRDPYKGFVKRMVMTPGPKRIELTLETKMGFDSEIAQLFASLASALGFETRYVMTTNRETVLFSKNLRNRELIEWAGVAVKVEEKWVFADPSDVFLPFGALDRRFEDQTALLVGPESFGWVRTPSISVDRNRVERDVELTIGDDLNGTATIDIKYTGHPAIELKHALHGLSDDEARTMIVKRIGVAASNSKLKVAKINSQAFVDSIEVKLELTIQGIVSKADRLRFLIPAIVSARPPGFESTLRRYAIQFKSPIAFTDRVRVTFPDGTLIQNIDPIVHKASFGTSLEFDYRCDVHSSGLTLKHTLVIGGDGQIVFPVSDYRYVKQFFDEVQRSQNTAIAYETVNTIKTENSNVPLDEILPSLRNAPIIKSWQEDGELRLYCPEFRRLFCWQPTTFIISLSFRDRRFVLEFIQI